MSGVRVVLPPRRRLELAKRLRKRETAGQSVTADGRRLSELSDAEIAELLAVENERRLDERRKLMRDCQRKRRRRIDPEGGERGQQAGDPLLSQGSD